MRMGRMGHDPMARPAPIACSDAPKRKTEPSAPRVAAPAGGNGRATTIKANWPEVVRRVIQRSGLSYADVARKCKRAPSMTTKWIEGRAVPGREPAEVLKALYAEYVGGELP